MTDELRAVVDAIARDARAARDAARLGVRDGPYTAPAYAPDDRTTVNLPSCVDSQSDRPYR